MKSFLLFICFLTTTVFSYTQSHWYVHSEIKYDISTKVPRDTFKTIQEAIEVAKGGDSIHVLPGIYRKQFVLLEGDRISGTPGRFTTLIAEGKPGSVVIDGRGLPLQDGERRGLITVSGVSNVRIQGFEVRNLETGRKKKCKRKRRTIYPETPVGILVKGDGSNIEILDNVVHGISNHSTCNDEKDGNKCSTGAHGIAVFGNGDSGITNLSLKRNEVYNCILSSSEAFVINGSVDGFIVEENYVHDNNNIGFDFIGYENVHEDTLKDRARNGLVINNRAERNSTMGRGHFSSNPNPWYHLKCKPDGNGSAAGFYVDGGQYIILDRNTSIGNDIGVEVASEYEKDSSQTEHERRYGEDIIIRNNYISQNKEGGIVLGGYDKKLGGARRVYVLNNSLYKNDGWATELYFQHWVKDCRFENNIFFNADQYNNGFDDQSHGNSSGNKWGKNIWCVENTSDLEGLEGDIIALGSIFINPESGRLALSSRDTLAINTAFMPTSIAKWKSSFWSKGDPAAAWTSPEGNRDREGSNRRNGPLDIGAFEYDPKNK